MLWQRIQWIGVCLAIGAASNVQEARAQYTLETYVEPAEAGVVASSPSSAEITYGDFVTVTATPLEGYIFVGWEGDIVASESTMTFEMVDDTVLTAVFEEDPGELFTLTAYVDPSGAGTIVRDPADTGYAAGTEVTVTAFANPGFAFTGWTGDVPDDADTTSASITVTVNEAMDLQATFAAASTLADDAEAGTDGAACGTLGLVSMGALFGLMLTMKLGRSVR